MNTIQERIAQGEAHRRARMGIRGHLARHAQHAMAIGLSSLALLSTGLAYAQETVCARVKIEIKQDLTLERQAFDAQMKIINTTTTGVIENVSVVVKVTEENGTPVAITDDPNNLNAKFFVRISYKENIANVDGTGTVNPNTTSTIDWLVIPAPGSAGSNPAGKKYLVGATLKYRFGGEDQVLDVSPDVITVKPLPLLTLDYFLTQDVVADDPLTAEIEATEPFTLGVRVKNTGFATARNLKIDSAQPKIVENNQGLLINFKLAGSYLNDAPVQNTLLLNFGDIAANASKMGRWLMETTLAGKFTEFTAKFSHADELGGTLTSIMQATNAHFLIRDVRVDLPGRDYVRDFLAQDGDVIRVYESDGPDTLVTDRSSVGQLTAGVNSAGNPSYQLVFPPTSGFIYAKLPDPFQGQKALGQIARSDAKVMLPENVWLSKTRNTTTKQWEYWINFFDVNTPGSYSAEFKAPPAAARPPLIQFVPDRVVVEGKQVSFMVEASSPDGRAVTLTAALLPTGATFVAQPVQAGLATSALGWTPAKGQAGNYLISYTVTDGMLSSTRSANIKVEVAPPPVPKMPTIVSPLTEARVATFRPALIVQTGSAEQDTTTKVEFEVYADSAMSQLIGSGLVDKGVTSGDAGTTSFMLTKDLNEDTRYWWRVRGFDGASFYSQWVNSRFFINTANNPPGSFNLTSPAPAVEVASLTPSLTWTNSVDSDEDAVTYSVYVYKDALLTDLMTSAANLAPGAEGSTTWVVDLPLTNHTVYYWLAKAMDAKGATTDTPARPFTVNTGNTAPTAPVILSPLVGGQTATPTTALTIMNSTDAENDLITYVFEIDTVNTFDSGNKQTSGPVIQGSGGSTSWSVTNLIENKRYYWRVKAQDGRTETDWVAGNFLMNAVNEAPPAPTVRNPGSESWVATQTPVLEVNPVLDPEGDAVRYQFEVYRAATFAKVADGISDSSVWTGPVALDDKTTYSWRVRAIDPQGAASDWSVYTVMYISTSPYIDPVISLTAPATHQAPVDNSGVKTVTIRWNANDPNIESTIALYYSTANSGYAGNLIVDGLKQSAGAQAGSYVWDVTQMAPGAYYIYAVIYDAKGIGRSYAPGAVVIAPPTQTGSIVVTANSELTTTEGGGTATFKVNLGNAPIADVIVPISSGNLRLGGADPATLVFTPQNWSASQTVTVTAVDNCVPDGVQRYQVAVGKATSLDPNYIDLQGTPVPVKRLDNDIRVLVSTTGNDKLFLCNYKVVSERKISPNSWEYAMTGELSNTGVDLGGLTATLQNVPWNAQVVDAELTFGAIRNGDTIKGADTFILRTSTPMPKRVLELGIGFRWSVITR
jgi:hypothetical protein